jgi:hypothetical protein
VIVIEVERHGRLEPAKTATELRWNRFTATRPHNHSDRFDTRSFEIPAVKYLARGARLLPADPNTTQAHAPLRFDLDVTDAMSPAGITERIWPSEKRRIKQIQLGVSGWLERVHRPQSEGRTCAHHQPDRTHA